MVNTKIGLSYFAVDTDIFQDRKIKQLKRNFGCPGIAILFYLLAEVYRDKGCGLEWDENTALDVADYLGVKETLVDEVVKYCGAVGLFDATLLTSGIITSEAIQRRYVEMSKRAKRTTIEIPEKWRIITEDSANIPETFPNTSRNIPETFLPKEKKSKVKESKEKEREHTPSKSAASAAADGGAEYASLSFSTASPLFPYTEPVDRVDLRSELAPYVPDYDEHASEVDRLTQCGHPQNENTESLR